MASGLQRRADLTADTRSCSGVRSDFLPFPLPVLSGILRLGSRASTSERPSLSDPTTSAAVAALAFSSTNLATFPTSEASTALRWSRTLRHTLSLTSPEMQSEGVVSITEAQKAESSSSRSRR